MGKHAGARLIACISRPVTDLRVIPRANDLGPGGEVVYQRGGRGLLGCSQVVFLSSQPGFG